MCEFGTSDDGSVRKLCPVHWTGWSDFASFAHVFASRGVLVVVSLLSASHDVSSLVRPVLLSLCDTGAPAMPPKAP